MAQDVSNQQMQGLYQALSGRSQPAAAPSGSPGSGAAPSLYQGLQQPGNGMPPLQSSPMSADADNTSNGLQLGPMVASNTNAQPSPTPSAANVQPANVSQQQMKNLLDGFNKAR